MTTQQYQRPAGNYVGETGLPNRTKYNDDSTASPKRPISSTKVDGDINYLIDAVNQIYDTAVSGIVADGSVTNAKIRDSAGCSLIGRATATTGVVADITATINDTVLVRKSNVVQFSTIPAGAIDNDAVTTSTIANTNVTFAKIQNVNTGVLLGRTTAGAGSVETVTVGTGLSLSAGVLDAVRTRNMAVLTSGTSWSVPANVTQVYARVVGGGGGGGCQSANGALAGGGGAGGVSAGFLAVTPSGSVTYSVGAGGAGATTTGAAGATGGASTFGSLTSNGGLGGGSSNAYGATASGGVGGTASGGNINISGQRGFWGIGTSGVAPVGGQGGAAAFGLGLGGQSSPTPASVGEAGVGYGSGGGGGCGNGTAIAGGAGASGVIILEY